MRTKKNPNIDYFDAFNRKPTDSWLYANWKPLYVLQHQRQLRLAISLPLMRFSLHVMKQCYDKIPIFYNNEIFFVDPFTPQTHPDAQVQNFSDRIKNTFQFDMEEENSWFTITPILEYSKWPAIFWPKDVSPLSRTDFGCSKRCWDLHASNSGTKPLLALLQGKLYWNSLENSSFPIHQSMVRNNFLIMLREWSFMWITCFLLNFSKSNYGHLRINRLRSRIVWNLFHLLFVNQICRRSHSDGLKTCKFTVLLVLHLDLARHYWAHLIFYS